MSISRISTSIAVASFLAVVAFAIPQGFVHAQDLSPASCTLKVGDIGSQIQIKYTTGPRAVTSTSIDLVSGTIQSLQAGNPEAELSIYWATGNNPYTSSQSQLVFNSTVPDQGSYTTVTTFPFTGLLAGTTYSFVIKDFHSNQSCSLGTVTTLGGNPPVPGTTPGQVGTPGTPSGLGSGNPPSTMTTPGNPASVGSGNGAPSTPTDGDQSRLQNFTNINSIPEAFGALLNKIIIPIAIPFVALAIIYTGFLFVAARGNEDKLSKAKEALKWTIIGTAIVLGAYVIAQVVENTVNEIRPTSANITISEIHHV